MAQRVSYLRDDGTYSTDRADAHRLASSDIISKGGAASSVVPAVFFDAIAVRESGRATNEQDEDLRKDGTTFHTSYGLYQIDDEEFTSVSGLFGDLMDPDVSTTCFARLCERRFARICSAAGWDGGSAPQSAWALVGVAHNTGLGRMVTIIGKVGGDWDAIKGSQLLGTHKDGSYDADLDARRARYGDYILSRLQSGGTIPPVGDGSGSDLQDYSDVLAPPSDSSSGAVATELSEDTTSTEDTPQPSEDDVDEYRQDAADEVGVDGTSGFLNLAVILALLYLARRL